MKNFQGIIIEESLNNKDILNEVKILKTEIEKVTPEHNTPYLQQWTLHLVEVPEQEIEKIAEKLSKNLHKDWYADLKNNQWHYVIFQNKIFKIDRTKPEQYEEAVEYGLSLGIPYHQLDFSPDIKEAGKLKN